MASPSSSIATSLALILEDTADDPSSNLNPNAPVFTPSWTTTAAAHSEVASDGSDEDAAHAQQYYHAQQPSYYAQGFSPPANTWSALGSIDDAQLWQWTAREDAMRNSLHRPQQKPKGNTYGRSVGGAYYNHGRWA
jgi:hypothetical protein